MRAARLREKRGPQELLAKPRPFDLRSNDHLCRVSWHIWTQLECISQTLSNHRRRPQSARHGAKNIHARVQLKITSQAEAKSQRKKKEEAGKRRRLLGASASSSRPRLVSGPVQPRGGGQGAEKPREVRWGRRPFQDWKRNDWLENGERSVGVMRSLPLLGERPRGERRRFGATGMEDWREIKRDQGGLHPKEIK